MSGHNTKKNLQTHCLTDINLDGPPPGAHRTCPFHAPILNLKKTNDTNKKDLSVMERFLKEGPAEQSSIFVRPDTDKLSISKDCHCGRSTGKGKERL